MKLSIVTTLFHSEKFIVDFTERVLKFIPNEFLEVEIVFVNDGSPDNSSSIVVDLQKNNPFIKLIELSRNFGHHYAILAGLNEASGDYVFLIDVDLEEDPQYLIPLWEKIIISNYEVDCCYGVQKTRKGSWKEKYLGIIFYKFISLIGEIEYPSDTLTARVMSKRYVESLIQFKEKNIDLWGVFAMNGFKQDFIYLNKLSKGTTTYSLKKKIKMSFDIITSISSKPLVYIFYIGLFLFFTSFCYILYVLYKYISNDMSDAIGWSSVIASIWFLGSLIILFLGTLSIYISRIFIEVKNRPNYIIKKNN